MKTIMMLGASHFQTPAIKYAKEAGYTVISVDNIPSNPGHTFSDRYENISTLDKNKVLTFAQTQPIDGILAYASDPSAPTAAYVAEKLGLPGNPYHSVLTLQRKDLFRDFLVNNGYNVPRSKTFHNQLEAAAYVEYLLESQSVIIKPVDSSGSKGVNKIELMSEFETHFNHAKQFSSSGNVIIEELIQKKGYQMDGDGFVWQGKLAFSCFGNQHNNVNAHPYVPVGISFPYSNTGTISQIAEKQVNDILTRLDMHVGGLNIEYVVDPYDKIYILEIEASSKEVSDISNSKL
jgi:carbamoylphosphate synthase large subunit